MPAPVLRVLAIAPVLLGALVLLGWALDVEWLRYLSPLDDQPRVKANTAVCIVALALCLMLLIPQPVGHSRRWSARLLAGLVCFIAGLTLAQHLLGFDAGIDQLLVREQPGAARTPHLGRMAANTALALLLMAVAMLVFEARWRGRRPANLLAAVAGTLAVIALDGIVLGTDNVPLFSQYARMAGATAIALLMLALGVVLARGDTMTTRLLAGDGPAGITTRRLIPAIFVVPTALAWARLEGQRRGLYGLELGTWLLVVALTGVFAIVAWRLVRRLDAAERRSREAEEQTRAALEAAEHANTAKSTFISRMSHELRTPLNSILGFGQLMELDGVAEHHREHVGHIQRSGRHLLELVNEILEISRIEAARLTISPEAVHLASAVSECVALMEPLAQDRGITLSVSAQPSATYVAADHQRLRQVLLNLLANAVKFNKPRGHVTVSWSEDQDTVRIGICDTGIGIAADHLADLFVPFERLGADDGPEEGTGLGLALSHRLARLMGGSIEVASDPGQGTTFTVTLPTAAPPETPVPATPADDPAAFTQGAFADRALHVIYIEDNPANRRLVEAVLEPHPTILQSAGSAAEGLRLVSQERPDVVLLDMHLPDGSGLDVLQRLKAEPDTAEIPVILLTADATKLSRQRASELGAEDYLTKPLDVTQLLRALERAGTGVGGGRAVASSAGQV